MNLLELGADPTGERDSAPAINAAIRAVSEGMPMNPVGLPYGGEVALPRGKFRLASPIQVIRGVHLHGESGSGWYGGTWLCPDAEVDGIQIHRYNTGQREGVGSWQAGAGDWAVVSNLNIMGGRNGVQMFARARLENMLIRGCSNDGIQIDTSGVGTSEDVNANNWSVSNIRIELCGRHGLWTKGVNSNAGTATSVDCYLCQGWSFFDQSFLGNTYIGCHTQGSVLGGFKADGQVAKNVYIGCYAEEDQINEFCAPAMIIGGILAAVPYKVVGGGPPVVLDSKSMGGDSGSSWRVPVSEPFTQRKLSAVLGGGSVLGFGPDSYSPDQWTLGYRHPYWSLLYKNSKPVMSLTAPLDEGQAPPSGYEGPGELSFPTGINLMQGYLSRKIEVDHKKPEPNEGKWGDVRFNSHPTDFVGWVNVQGKWKPFGKIEK